MSATIPFKLPCDCVSLIADFQTNMQDKRRSAILPTTSRNNSPNASPPAPYLNLSSRNTMNLTLSINWV